MNTIIRGVLVGMVLVLGSAHGSNAQSCPTERTACAQFWTGLSTIFVGRVTAIRPARQLKNDTSTRSDKLRPQKSVAFEVERSYDKHPVQELELETMGGGGARAFEFVVGERYLVFAEDYRLLEMNKRLVVRPCSGTTLARLAQDDIAYLESVFKLNPAADILDFHEPVIHAGILQGRGYSLPKPAYPPLAKAAHASGPVLVLLLLNESGRVMKAKAICGNPLLLDVSEAAASQARFDPITVSGRPTKVSTFITYNFSMN